MRASSLWKCGLLFQQPLKSCSLRNPPVEFDYLLLKSLFCRKELRQRQINYNKFLDEVKRKVDERPLLFEQHDQVSFDVTLVYGIIVCETTNHST